MTIKIVGFTGSLRKDSFNKAALRAAAEMLPDDVELELVDLTGIPFLNEDEEAKGFPPSVVAFRGKLAAADGVLISTPKYNYSIPPVLKNALDWASRGDEKPLFGKPTAILSVSPGMLGGARVQYHLRQVCVALNLLVLNKPEVFIGNAEEKFDDKGRLVDSRSRAMLQRLLKALVQRIRENL